MNRNYFKVEILVPAPRAAAFEKAVAAYLAESDNGFKQRNWTLCAALRSTGTLAPLEAEPPTDFPPADGSIELHGVASKTADRLVHFINLWSYDPAHPPEMRMMQEVLESTGYNDIDKLVGYEAQQLTWLGNGAGALAPATPVGAGPILRITWHVQSTQAVDFAEQSWLSAFDLITEGWHFIGQLQSVTGALNAFGDYWQLPIGADAKTAVAHLRDKLKPYLDDAFTVSAAEVFTVANYWPG